MILNVLIYAYWIQIEIILHCYPNSVRVACKALTFYVSMGVLEIIMSLNPSIYG